MIHRDQLANCDEFVSFCQQCIQGRRHGIYSLLMNIMGQNDRAGLSATHYPLGNHRRSGPLPIKRIDRPKYDIQSKLLFDPFSLRPGDCSVRWSQQRGDRQIRGPGEGRCRRSDQGGPHGAAERRIFNSLGELCSNCGSTRLLKMRFSGPRNSLAILEAGSCNG